MEMAFLVIKLYAGVVIMPSQYEKAQCEEIASEHGSAFCVPAPKGPFCKYHWQVPSVDEHGNGDAIKVCD